MNIVDRTSQRTNQSESERRKNCRAQSAISIFFFKMAATKHKLKQEILTARIDEELAVAVRFFSLCFLDDADVEKKGATLSKLSKVSPAPFFTVMSLYRYSHYRRGAIM